MTSTSDRTSTRIPRPVRDTRWLALALIAVAQLMVALDATIVNVALPSAQSALGFDDADRAWVVTAYTCTFAGLLLLGGRIADRVGRRRAFLGGLAGFAVASAVAGLAPDFGVLVAGRALQGAFAAVLTPTALSLVATTFADERERAKAFGVYGAVASSGAVVGLVLGGLLTEYAGWRWCLFVNVGIAIAVAMPGRKVLAQGDGFPNVRVDAASAALVTAGLAAIVLGSSQAAAHGWDSVSVLGPGLLGAGLVAAFLVRQGRAANSLLPLWILADRSRAGAYIAAALSVVGSFGMFLMLTYHFQVVLGWSPLRTGLAFLPLSIAVSASAYSLGSHLLPKVAPRMLIVPGLALAAGGLGLLSTLTPRSGYPTLILPAEVLLGLGMGLVMTPAISVATREIEPRYAGLAAATAHTAMQVGSSVGTAVLNSIAVVATASYVAARGVGAGADDHAALVDGYATATTCSALALAVTALLVALTVRTPQPQPHA